MKPAVTWAVAAAILMSGCDRKAEGQSVAVVNDDEITAAELNGELAQAKLPSTLSKEEARSRVLEALIDRRLLAQQAAKEGLDKSPEYLNQQRRMSENLLVSMLVSRQLNTSELPPAADIKRFQDARPGMFAKRETWTLQQVQFPTPKDPKVSAKIAASNTFDELIRALGAAGLQIERGSAKVDTATLPNEAYAKILTLRPDQPFIVPGAERSVASIIVAKEPAPLNENQARGIALNALRNEKAAKLLQDRAKAARTSANVEYQAGFAPPKKK